MLLLLLLLLFHRTPLFAATHSLCCSLLLLLFHRTPLFAATHSGHTKIVELLTAAGAQLDLGLAEDGATPLFMASGTA